MLLKGLRKRTKALNCQQIIFVINHRKSVPNVLLKGLRKRTKGLICHHNIYFIDTKKRTKCC